MNPDKPSDNQNGRRVIPADWDRFQLEPDAFEDYPSIHAFDRNTKDQVDLDQDLLELIQRVYFQLSSVLGINGSGDEIHIMLTKEKGLEMAVSKLRGEYMLVLPEYYLGNWRRGLEQNSALYSQELESFKVEYSLAFDRDPSEEEVKFFQECFVSYLLAHEIFHLRQSTQQADVLKDAMIRGTASRLLIRPVDFILQYYFNQGERSARGFSLRFLKEIMKRSRSEKLIVIRLFIKNIILNEVKLVEKYKKESEGLIPDIQNKNLDEIISISVSRILGSDILGEKQKSNYSEEDFQVLNTLIVLMNLFSIGGEEIQKKILTSWAKKSGSRDVFDRLFKTDSQNW